MEKKQKLIIGLVTALLIVIGIGASYAFFTAEIAGSESSSTIKARAGEMTINYNGGANLEVSGIYPSSTPWITKNFTITGKNTTDLDMEYKVSLVVEENTFQNNEIAYTLTSSAPTNGVVIANKTQTYINGVSTIEIGTGKFTKTGSTQMTHDYTLKIYYPNKSQSQNNNQNAILKAYLLTEEYRLPMPNKRDVITMNIGFGDQQFKVIKINNGIAEVLSMNNFTEESTTKFVYDNDGDYTDFNGTNGLEYAGSDIDNFLNTTVYEKLNIDANSALVEKNIIQNMYSYDSTNYTLDNAPSSGNLYQYNFDDLKWKNTSIVGSVPVGNRYIYLLDMQDIFEYVGKRNISGNELIEMFYNGTLVKGEFLWLRSAYGSYKERAWAITSSSATLGGGSSQGSMAIRIAFTIDLSKISWTSAS